MQGGHCPACGTALTGYGCGCGCLADVTDTAVLPPVEGPPLVRPYVPAVSAATDWSEDLYGTAVLPPMPPAPPAAPPAGPMPAYIPTQPSSPQSAPRELGLYPIATAPQATPGRASSPRAGRHRGARFAMVGAGAGVVALGVGLAFAFGSPPDVKHDAEVPLPTSAPDLAPTPTTGPTSAAPSLAPSSPPTTSAKPSPSRSRPATRPTTQTPVSVTSAPAPATSAPASSAPPSPSAPPSATAAPRDLGPGDSGPQVVTLQQQLSAANCGRHLNSGVYDSSTQRAVANFQEANGLWQDQWGVYGPQTRAALESGTTC